MSMLDKKTLEALKEKMPTSYESTVQKRYEELNGKTVSIRTVRRFFAGDTYTTNMHKAVVDVIREKESLMLETLDQVTNG